MKVIAYCALHYGRDYLGWSIRSVIDYVDEFWILYAKEGSHGARVKAVCPDNRGQLYDIAKRAAGKKLRWHDGSWPYEGAQRETIHHLAPDADAILVVDYDEIWGPGMVEAALATANDGKRQILLPFIHYWRSFRRAIIHDPSYPVRVIYPNYPDGVGGVDTTARVNHMGYAITPEMMAYKWLIHGHRAEMRKDVDYVRDVYLKNRQVDCHPVGNDYWNAEVIEPLDYMPEWMQEHPYYNMEVIQ